MTKRIFHRILFELFLVKGLICLLIWLTMTLAGRTHHPLYQNLVNSYVVHWTFWRHSTFPTWEKLLISLGYFFLVTLAWEALTTDGTPQLARAQVAYLGLSLLLLAGFIWKWLPLSHYKPLIKPDKED